MGNMKETHNVFLKFSFQKLLGQLQDKLVEI